MLIGGEEDDVWGQFYDIDVIDYDIEADITNDFNQITEIKPRNKIGYKRNTRLIYIISRSLKHPVIQIMMTCLLINYLLKLK